MAILSRHTIDATGVVGAPSRVFDRPRLLWARVRLDGGPPLVAVSVHAAAPDSLLPPPYNPIRRNRQLAAVAAFAQRLIAEPAPLLVGGDFNTVRYAIPGMIDAALAGGDRRATWRGLPLAWLPPMLRLDRIFVGPGMRLVEAHVAVDHHGSDHCPVLATVGTGEFSMGSPR